MTQFVHLYQDREYIASSYLNALALQLIHRRQGTGGRLEVYKSVSLASVSCLVQDSLSRDDRSESKKKKVEENVNDVSSLLLTQVDEVLVCGVGGESPDVEVGPGQRLSVASASTLTRG